MTEVDIVTVIVTTIHVVEATTEVHFSQQGRKHTVELQSVLGVWADEGLYLREIARDCEATHDQPFWLLLEFNV